MSANLDLAQRAVVLQITVVGTLADSTFNGLVCFAVHSFIPLCWITQLVCDEQQKTHLYFCGKIMTAGIRLIPAVQLSIRFLWMQRAQSDF